MQIINKSIRTVLVAAGLLFCVPSFSAGSVHIDNIDTVRNFPFVDVFVHVNMVPVGVSEFSQTHFRILENGTPVEVRDFQKLPSDSDTLYLVLSLDSSKSISREFLARIKVSAREIIRSTGPTDKIAVYRFNDRSVRLRDFITDRKDLIRAIEDIERHGKKTLLYENLYESLDFMHVNSGGNGAVIVFTDGVDEGSSITDNDVISSAKQKGIPVYFISLKDSGNSSVMNRIAKLTGGILLYHDDTKELSDLYRTILLTHKNKYWLQYRASPDSRGGIHTVKVLFDYNSHLSSDSRQVRYKEPLLYVDSLTGLTVILLGLIFILLLIITVTFFYFLKREKKLLEAISDVKARSGVNRQEKFIELEETERMREEEVLSSLDPEYTYANAWLVEKVGPETGKKFPIYWDEVTIGRSKDNSIVVDDQSVSMTHAKIKNLKNSYHIFDLVSDNGTFLNGKKLLRPKALYDWDEIQVGRSRFVFRGSKRPH